MSITNYWGIAFVLFSLAIVYITLGAVAIKEKKDRARRKRLNTILKTIKTK